MLTYKATKFLYNLVANKVDRTERLRANTEVGMMDVVNGGFGCIGLIGVGVVGLIETAIVPLELIAHGISANLKRS